MPHPTPKATRIASIVAARFGALSFDQRMAAGLFGLMVLQKPAGYGLGLPGIYVMWLVAVILLYPLCRWFASLKQRRSEWWWSYL